MTHLPRLIGAMLILISGFSFGLIQVRNFRQEEAALEDLIRIIDILSAELSCRLTPLPELCAIASGSAETSVGRVFHILSIRLHEQISPSAGQCMDDVLREIVGLPELTQTNLMRLAQGLGRFDLEGQLAGLETVKQMCKRNLAGLQSTRETKLKSTQVLGFCAGAALVILLI